jgi:hypothetical protein
VAEELDTAPGRAADSAGAGQAATTGVAGQSAAGQATADGSAAAGRREEVAGHRRRAVSAAYALGFGAQVLFWCLVFLALAVAIATGGHLTEFRYVGF